MNNVLQLREYQKNQAPAGFIWSLSETLFGEACLLESNLTKMSELISSQLTLVESLIAALPDVPGKARLKKSAQVTQQQLTQVYELLAEYRAHTEKVGQ